MKISESATYDDATPAQVFALITDEDFRGDVCEKVHAISHAVRVERSGDEATVTIERVMPTEMPDFVKKLVGETVSVAQIERWGAADAQGNRTADVDVQIVGQPAGMTGTSTLRVSGADTVLDVDGDVAVKIPFLGKKIEPEVAKAVVSAIRVEARAGIARLKA